MGSLKATALFVAVVLIAAASLVMMAGTNSSADKGGCPNANSSNRRVSRQPQLRARPGQAGHAQLLQPDPWQRNGAAHSVVTLTPSPTPEPTPSPHSRTDADTNAGTNSIPNTLTHPVSDTAAKHRH